MEKECGLNMLPFRIFRYNVTMVLRSIDVFIPYAVIHNKFMLRRQLFSAYLCVIRPIHIRKRARNCTIIHIWNILQFLSRFGFLSCLAFYSLLFANFFAFRVGEIKFMFFLLYLQKNSISIRSLL
jgi:hypothetical protein